MPREIDERKKRKALRKLRKAADLAEQGLGPPLSDWEKQFLEEVEERIETYGSAFADPGKGDRAEPLSALQSVKLREIDKKARGKGKTGFSKKKPKKSDWKPNVRQLDDCPEETEPRPTPPVKLLRPKLVEGHEPTNEMQEAPAPKKLSQRPKLRLIKGGADSD